MKLFYLFLGILLAFGILINEMALPLVYLMVPDGATVTFVSASQWAAIKTVIWMGTVPCVALAFVAGYLYRYNRLVLRWGIMPAVMLIGSGEFVVYMAMRLHTRADLLKANGVAHVLLDINSLYLPVIPLAGFAFGIAAILISMFWDWRDKVREEKARNITEEIRVLPARAKPLIFSNPAWKVRKLLHANQSSPCQRPDRGQNRKRRRDRDLVQRGGRGGRPQPVLDLLQRPAGGEP